MAIRWKASCLYANGVRAIEARVYEGVAADLTGSLQKTLVLRRETPGEGVVMSKPLLELRSPTLERFFENTVEFSGYEQVDGVWYFQRLHLVQS